MWSKPLLLFSLLADCIVLLVLPQFLTEGLWLVYQQLALLIAHGLLSLVYIAALRGVLPSPYDELPVTQFSAILAIVLFIPIIGMTGVLLACLPAFYFPITKEQVSILYGSLLELPFKPESEDNYKKPVSHGSIKETLRFSKDVDERVSAVLAIRYIDSADAVGLLLLALKDKADDVRLLAYAIIDHKETRIRDDIRELMATQSSGQWIQPEAFSRQIAQRYWQLVELGLLQGSSLEKEAAREAQKYASLVLEKQSDLQMSLLLARYHLYSNEPERVKEYLNHFRGSGLPEKWIHRERAELALQNRDIERLRFYIKTMQEVSGNSEWGETVMAPHREVVVNG